MLVAVLLGFGVLLGSGALAVDVGRLHAEREQLQSGADAAALAVARNCVTAPSSCASQDSVADTFASDNANDGASAATVCGTLTGLSACGAAADNLTACIGSPPSSCRYARPKHWWRAEARRSRAERRRRWYAAATSSGSRTS